MVVRPELLFSPRYEMIVMLDITCLPTMKSFQRISFEPICHCFFMAWSRSFDYLSCNKHSVTMSILGTSIFATKAVTNMLKDSGKLEPPP